MATPYLQPGNLGCGYTSRSHKSWPLMTVQWSLDRGSRGQYSGQTGEGGHLGSKGIAFRPHTSAIHREVLNLKLSLSIKKQTVLPVIE